MRGRALLWVGSALLVAACGGSSKSSNGSGGSAGAAGTDGGAGTAGTGGGAGTAGTGGSAGTAGSGGSGGTAGSGGSGGTAGSGGSGGTAGAGGSGGCAGGCGVGFKCCGSTCVNPNNDINNCGTCGHACTGSTPYCNNGTCGTPPCTSGTSCGKGQTCCGSSCCGAGQLCCVIPGPTTGPPKCTAPDNGTCPKGCPSCVCASPDTPIATPRGAVAIAELHQGDLVYSVDQGRIVAVPIARTNRAPAQHHVVMHFELANGSTLEISGGHPTADGRHFSDLDRGDLLGGVRILHARAVAYHHPFTYDILPASDTGTYFAGGVLIGSTLAPPAVANQCVAVPGPLPAAALRPAE